MNQTTKELKKTHDHQWTKLSFNTREQDMNSYSNELRGICNYLSKDEYYSDCQKELEAVIGDAKSSSNIEIKRFDDVYSILDMVVSGLKNSDALKILKIAEHLAKKSGSIHKESDYASEAAKRSEEDENLLDALETEKNFCYTKSENIDTRIVFGHYVNIIKLAVKSMKMEKFENKKEELKEELYRCLSKMFYLVPSSCSNIPKTRKAISNLLRNCNYSNLEQREIVQEVLDNCKYAFPDLNTFDKNYIEDLIKKWKAPHN